jgi:hypothetical protein
LSFSNFPLAILFSSKRFLHQKAQSKRPKQKNQANPPQKKPPCPPSEVFINSSKQGGAKALREGLDIVTGETCLPAL